MTTQTIQKSTSYTWNCGRATCHVTGEADSYKDAQTARREHVDNVHSKMQPPTTGSEFRDWMTERGYRVWRTSRGTEPAPHQNIAGLLGVHSQTIIRWRQAAELPRRVTLALSALSHDLQPQPMLVRTELRTWLDARYATGTAGVAAFAEDIGANRATIYRWLNGEVTDPPSIYGLALQELARRRA